MKMSLFGSNVQLAVELLIPCSTVDGVTSRFTGSVTFRLKLDVFSLNGIDLVKFHDLFDNDPIKFKIHGMFDFGGSTFQNKGGIDNVSDICGPRDRVELLCRTENIALKGQSRHHCCFKLQQFGSKLFVRIAPSDTSLPNLS